MLSTLNPWLFSPLSLHTYMEGGIAAQDPGEVKEKLKVGMAESNARWKLAIGHHPMRSNGFWSDVADLRDSVEEVLAENGVTAYFNGHDHDLQHTAGRWLRCKLDP